MLLRVRFWSVKNGFSVGLIRRLSTRQESVDSLIEAAVGQPILESRSSWSDWKMVASKLQNRIPNTAAIAFLGGFHGATLSQVFAFGYQAAIINLLEGVRKGELARGEFWSFLVSEKGGNSPKAIETTLKKEQPHHLLSGTKTFATLGASSALLA
eukprot:Colp12_sorted_trinity150504_noHs@14120